MPSAEGTPRRARVPPSKPRPASSPKFVNGSGRSLPPPREAQPAKCRGVGRLRMVRTAGLEGRCNRPRLGREPLGAAGVSRLLAVALGQLTGLVAKCLASTTICGFSVASSVGSIDMK
jgi:hypothetical protein